jgi:uncharacterized protein (TIGR03083 family)
VTTAADRVIEALQSGHGDLAPLVASLSLEQLEGPSAASEWTVAQVLSHLGSGAVISLATLDAALAGRPNPGGEANQVVWARWNAMGSQQQADEFVAADTALLARYDSIDADTRQTLLVDLGFLPAAVDLATAARFRLSEFALHSWDVRVALTDDATVRPEAVGLLLDQVATMFGWLAKPAALQGKPAQLRVDLSDAATVFGVTLSEAGSGLGEVPEAPDGVVTLPAEAWLRLVYGRLSPERTPTGVTATGDVSLDTLRQVFPGF